MLMPDQDTIKSIVESNFDLSAEMYNAFEDQSHHFYHLASQLAEFVGIESGMTVVDVGCGTGISTYGIAKAVGREGQVIGIDLSEGMLRKARDRPEERMIGSREKMAPVGSIEFRKGDAEELEACIGELAGKVDAVMYNASIFLLPDAGKALLEAKLSLKEGGVVGMNYPLGLWGNRMWRDGPDLFKRGKKEGLEDAPYGKSIVNIEKLPDFLRRAGFGNVRNRIIEMVLTREEVEAFYSIPAQSAGLYPKTPFPERQEKLRSLLDHFTDLGIEEFVQKWNFTRARKGHGGIIDPSA